MSRSWWWCLLKCDTCSVHWQHTSNLYHLWAFCSFKYTKNTKQILVQPFIDCSQVICPAFSAFLIMKHLYPLSSAISYLQVVFKRILTYSICLKKKVLYIYLYAIMLVAWLQKIYADKIANNPCCSIWLKIFK